jgi:hypothetical protein
MREKGHNPGMAKEPEWTKQAYEASVTSRAWRFTVYDDGWEGSKEHGVGVSRSQELRGIFAEEMALDAVPDWAIEIIDRMLCGPLPTCGHYSFPSPVLQVCEAIGAEKCPDFVLGCYTADAKWKTLMCYYVYCLDAWLKDSPLEIAKVELTIRDDLGKDWGRIVEGIYATLGEHTEQRALLVRRLVHRLRWWIKTLTWSDDNRNKFMLGVYLGDVRGGGDWGEYGDSCFGDPFFMELKVPGIIELERKIRETVPDGKTFVRLLRDNHLCGPKTFRNVERLIVQIGAVGSRRGPNYDVSILQCEDTYPDIASYKRWYELFMTSLETWLDGDEKAVAELGRITPVKHWLVRILRHRLQLYEKTDNFGKLIGAVQSGKSGTKLIP